MNLLELAKRCEEATGPDRELDAAIHEAVFKSPVLSDDEIERRRQSGENVFSGCIVWQGSVTASLDAAMQLVPKAYYWSAGTIAQDGYEHYDDMDFAWAQVVHRQRGDHIDCESAATAALALCAASLRARAAQQELGEW